MSATTTPLHKQLHTEAQFESAMKALTATKGNRAEADRQLRLAQPLLAQLGATTWAAEAETLLAASA